jgi:hypothetical protein
MLKEIQENPEAIKTLVRPIISVILVIGWVLLMLFQVEVYWLFHVVAGLMVLEWASERAFMRLREILGIKNGGSNAKK